MKKLIVKIVAEIDIPDEWELVDHEAGMKVLKVGDRFVDFDITPLAAASMAPEPIVTLSAIPTRPPIMTKSPTVTLPETPVCEANTQ